jgi:hypothetical protein
MNRLNIVKKYIVVVSILFFIDCANSHKVDENEMAEITNFLECFYYSQENNLDKIERWYLNAEIQFYIQNNIAKNAEYVTDNSIDKYSEMLIKFKKDAGTIDKRELPEITFNHTVYDVPLDDIYIVNCRGQYENLKTTETFFLKRDNHRFKVYRYFININK